MLDVEEQHKRVAEIIEELRVLGLQKSELGFELGPYWELRDMVPLIEDKLRRTHEFVEETLPDHKGRMINVAGIVAGDFSPEAKVKRKALFARLDNVRLQMMEFREAKAEYDWVKDRIKLLQAMIEKVRMADKPSRLPKPKRKPKLKVVDNEYEY